MKRVGDIVFNIKCNQCNTIQEIKFTNKEWEHEFYINDAEAQFSPDALIFVKCPNCGNTEEVVMN